MARELKPKPLPPLASAFVSQLTSVALLGVDARRFLEHVLPLCAGHVTRLGKLRLVPLDVATAKLRALADQDDASDEGEPVQSEPTTGDEALARWGFQRKRGGAAMALPRASGDR